MRSHYLRRHRTRREKSHTTTPFLLALVAVGAIIAAVLRVVGL